MRIERQGKFCDAKLDPENPNDRLLPCPLCGSDKVELVHTHTACYTVKCQAETCGAEVTGASAYELRKPGGYLKLFGRKRKLDFYPPAHTAAAYDAVCRWNRRHPETVGQALGITIEAMMRGEIRLRSVKASAVGGRVELDLSEIGAHKIEIELSRQQPGAHGPELSIRVRT